MAQSNLQQALPPEAIKDLRKELLGHIVLPGDRTYDSDRKLANSRFAWHPSAIIFCATEEDVRVCLGAVRRYNVAFRIRAGGHSTAGYSGSDDVLIDVKGLNRATVDTATQTAVVGCGCTLDELHRLLDQHKLYLPIGGGANVCIGGFVQGGGWGLTSRTFGMNSDNAVEIRIMLADGRIVRATEAINHDLWWAVRGGTGGNFGVLLTVKFQLHEAAQLVEWELQWPLAATSRGDRWENQVEALATLQKHYTGGGAVTVGAAAGINFVVSPPILWISGIFVGTVRGAETALRPLLKIPGGSFSLRPATSSHRMTRLLTPDPPQRPSATISWANAPWHRTSRFVARSIELGEWRAIIDHVLSAPTRYPEFQIHCYGGAIMAYPQDKSAFIHRNSEFCCYLQARWRNETQRRQAVAYLKKWGELMDPLWNGHTYQNFPDEEYPDYRQNYWGDAFPTLLNVKNKYDPSDMFAFPQMVKSVEHAADNSAQPPPLVAHALRRAIVVD